jgi:hypothetical protein
VVDGQDIPDRTASGIAHVDYCHIRLIFHVMPINISMMKSGTMAMEGTSQANLIFVQIGSP